MSYCRVFSFFCLSAKITYICSYPRRVCTQLSQVLYKHVGVTNDDWMGWYAGCFACFQLIANVQILYGVCVWVCPWNVQSYACHNDVAVGSFLQLFENVTMLSHLHLQHDLVHTAQTLYINKDIVNKQIFQFGMFLDW